MGIPKKKNDKASIIIKASLKYRNAFLLRALIQSLTKYGSSLDTILAGLGAKYQQARLKHFFKELLDRLNRLERITNYGPDEPLYDFITQVIDRVAKTRSKEKRKRFANLVANQLVSNGIWDEAEIACRLLSDLTEYHLQVLDIALKIEPSDHPFKGERTLILHDLKRSSERKDSGKVATKLSDHIPSLSSAALEMICFELMARGLLRDIGVSAFGGGQFMAYITATEMAQWFMNWICEPPIRT